MIRLETWLVLALTSLLVFAHDEDLEFEETIVQSQTSTPAPVRRHWGIPDMQAVVGKLFLARIPPDAFSGHVQFYEAGGRQWPHWLSLSRDGELKGVPVAADVGVSYLMVRAVGPLAHHYSKDIFAIDVIKPGLDTLLPHTFNKGESNCPTGVDPLMLTVVLSTELHNIADTRRVNMIETIAAYYAVPTDGWYLREVQSLQDDPTVVNSGSGNVNVPYKQTFAALSIQVGCGREIRQDLAGFSSRVSNDASDGTLAEVLQVPIARWYTHTELPTFFRERREIGSGDFFEEDDAEEDYNEGEGLTTPGLASVTAEPHPHRHHHGEGTENSIDTPEVEILEPSEVFYHRPATNLLMNYDVISTPAFIPERPSVGISITPTVTQSVTPSVAVTLPQSTNTETEGTTFVVSSRKPVTLDVNTVADVINTTLETDGTSAPTLPDISSSSISSRKEDETPGSVTTQLTTEEMEPVIKNFAPAIGQRLQKVAVVAGKALRLKLPENTFRDVEDGTTSHLSITLTDPEEQPLPLDGWITYNETSCEVLALPWEKHVHTWEFLLTASDKDGDSVSDTLELRVQQHKTTRSVNHEFSVGVRLAPRAYKHAVHWQLQLLAALASVYGDTDPSLTITVRDVSLTPDVNTFTWTNDTLPRTYCPNRLIDQLLKVISDDGYPTAALSSAVGPHMTITSVTWRGLENCEPEKPEELTTVAPPLAPSINYPPLFRNQVDQINATAGELLIFRVPEDTLYDPEDGGTRKLKMTLLHADRSPLSPTHWLQFDAKNQEFYGLPMDKDVRSTEYQLVCEDRGGLSANDGLVVVVRSRIHRRYSVEFVIALEVPYEKFQSSASLKRKFVEKLQELFGDPTPNNIIVHTIAPGATNDVTTITWFNSSLPTDHCPDEQIHSVRRRIIKDNERVTEELLSVMGSEMTVLSVGLEPSGACQGELTILHEPPPSHPPPGDSYRPISADDYLLTFVIPIAVIAVMLSLAGLVACLLYRKRHVVKLGAGDETDRQSFRSKGIPVIFQDELEEKPEPENKPPVIMKEERPPLPPPEYQRGGSLVGDASGLGGEDTPYHPPPPFTSSRDSNRAPRPKPTPTYRKPPPYVPP